MADQETQDYITLDASNASNKGSYHWAFPALEFNGVGVAYVPAEFVQKGAVIDGAQYWNNGFTDPEVLKYLKPVKLDPSLLKGSKVADMYPDPTTGYIFDWSSAVNANKETGLIHYINLGAHQSPISGVTKTADGYQYVGVGNNQYTTYSPTEVYSKWTESHGGIRGFLDDIGGALADLGPIVLLIDFIPGMQGVGSSLYAAGQLSQGNYKEAALAIVAANLPGAEGTSGMEGTILEIPSIKNMATSLAEIGLDAAAANAVMNGGIKLIASGGDIEASFKEVLGSYVGNKAGDYVNAMKQFDGYKDLQTITAGVTKASTAAFMKNQDVGKAASAAFINTAIPVAFNSVPGFKEFQKENPQAAVSIVNGAVITASGKDISLQETLRNSALDFMAERALSKSDGYASMTDAEKKAYKNLAISQAQGKPINNALYDIMTAKVQAGVNDASAKKEGWDSYEQKQSAISQYGKAITPAQYDEKTVTKDEALQLLKDAGLKRDPTDSELSSLMKDTEVVAKQLAGSIKDVDAKTFDATSYKTNEEALLAASNAGYNMFRSSDGQVYTIMSKDQYNNVVNGAKSTGKENPLIGEKLVDIDGKPISDLVLSTEIPEVVIVAKRLDTPTTYEGWLKDQQELNDLGATNFPKWISDQLNLVSIIAKENKGTTSGDTAKLIEQALAYGGRYFGSLAKQIAQSASATGLVEPTNVVARTAAAIERWGNEAQSKTVTGQEKAIVDYVDNTKIRLTKELGREPTTAELMAGQMKAFVTASYDNKLGAASLIVGESLQELPWMVASGGVGKMATQLFGKAAGYAAAIGTDATLNAAESFAGNYTDVYDQLRKKGYSDEAAKAKATTSGVEAALVTFGSSVLGDNALVKSFMGEATKLSAGMLTKEATKQYVTEYAEGMLQNASSQYAVNGKVDWSKATAAGAIEGAIGSAVSTGFITANNLNSSGIIGKDAKGNNVTLQEYRDGTKQVATLNDDFSLSKDPATQITIGDAKNYYTEFTKNPDITSTEYFQTVDFFRDSGYGTPTSDEIAKIVGGQTDLTGTNLQAEVNKYVDPYIIDQQELTDLFKAEGYGAPTAAELAKYTGKINESTGNAAATKYADELAVTSQEAKDALITAGITKPTADQIAQFTKAGKESDIIAQLNAYANPLVVTEAEAKQAFADQGILNPTKEQLAKFVKEGNQSTILADLAAYADPLATTAQEVKDAFTAQGYTPTEKEIADYTKAGSESDILKSIASYADPKAVTQEELIAAFKDEGLTRTPTKEELANFLGNKDEAKTIADIRNYADPFGVTRDEALQYFKDQGYTPDEKTLASFIGQMNEAETAGKIASTYDPLAVTEQEARDAFKAEGILNPTPAELASYIKQDKEVDVLAALSKYADPLAVTEQEVRDAFKLEGMSAPTAEQLAKFVRTGKESDILAELKTYADPLGVTEAELLDILKSEGYSKVPTKEELSKFTGAVNEAKTLEAARAYYDPLATTKDEVTQYFKDQGYTPTEEEVNKFIGDFLEKDVSGNITKTYDPLATTEQEVRDLFKTIGYEPSDAEVARYVGQKAEDVQLDLVKNYGNTALAVKELTGPLNTRIDELVKQGQDYQTATQNAIAELTTQNKGLTSLIGTEAKTVSQSDIDALTNMLSGKQAIDLSYDVNKDSKITQADIDALSKYVQSDTNTTPETNFDPYINTHWAPTGLYKTIYDQNVQRQKDLEAQKVAEAETARKNNLQFGMLGMQGVINSMLPQVQALQTQAQAQAAQPPEVVQKARQLDLGSPLDVGYFGESASPETDKEKLAQRQQGIVKIASGGSIDELLSLLYRG